MNNEANPHELFMRLALKQAAIAASRGEVPIGTVIVRNGTLIGQAHNQVEMLKDPTAHAEIVAIRASARAIGNYRLVGSTMYVTIEPCLMCVGAMVHARVGTVVFGAAEPKAGAIVSSCRAHELPSLNHCIEVVGGVLEEECRAVIQEFFKTRRGQV